MIEVRNLTKYFGQRCAVNGISFTVDEDTIVGFLGPNGAGKTTTIRILTGYMPPTSGTARVAGYDVLSQSMQVRSVVGYLPESVPLYPEMRVREYLDFRGKLRGLDGGQRQAAISRVVERCWLSEAYHRPIGQLSKGFRQRVGLADALLHSPKVLILDEPTVGLDPTQVRETRSLLRELAADHPILFSSHTLSEVEAICKRILIIHEGRIIASGTVEELKSQVGGERRVLAELKGPEADVAAGVRKLPDVLNVRVATDGPWTRLDIAAKRDASQAVSELAASRGWAVRELRQEQPSLEDFFVKAIIAARGGTR
ncbi:MAG TPA: ABC transporter ATP-binding protein [Phycisphaerae bacterium]|nr:ABC transporter ATP-binding protein [Phycisphaerae bacterium]